MRSTLKVFSCEMRHMVLRALISLIISAFFLSTPALAAPFLAIEQEGDSEVITLDVGTATSKKIFFLQDPERLVVDIARATPPSIILPSTYNGGLISNVRAAQFDPATARIVFDLTTRASLLTQSLENGQLIISIAGKAGAKPAQATKPKPQKPMIVIDPGHGGDDPGAIGPKRSQEKDIVLTFAKALQDAIIKQGKYRVTLTREADVFVPLQKRVKIARAAGANIFISLHADSAPGNDARGLSIYTLSEKASDAATAALAASENKVDILGGMDLSNEREDVADILISLAQRETRNNSGMLADILTLSLGKKVKLLNNPHRFAGFAVLKAPDVPSVLIETGFISHPAEEKQLKTLEYRRKLVAGIMDGIDRYFEKQKDLGN